MYLSKSDIEQTERVKRLKIINAISGIKPGNLLGTKSGKGQPNLAIFSSIVHLGSNPALLGFISRPDDDIRRHTFENIMETGFYTVNHIHRSFIEQAHYTSAKFAEDVSEFDTCNFTEEYLYDFHAPFVKESHFKMGLKMVEKINIKSSGTMMVVGEIQHLIFPDEAINEKGHINLETVNDIGISGLNTYYGLNKLDEFPYARVNELPDFK